MSKADYFFEQLTLFDECESQQTENILRSSSGKMYPVSSQQTADLILKPCLKKSQRPKFQCLQVENGLVQEWSEAESVRYAGESLTLNISECRNDAEESFLSQILQADAPPKYYLSARACQGILRRAAAKEKKSADGIKSRTDDSGKLKLYENHGQDCRWKEYEKVSQTVSANFGMGGNNTAFVSYGIGRDAFNQGQNGQFGLSIVEEIQPPLTAKGAGGCFDKKFVRRLTPLECERLQGLLDNFTLIDDKTCSDAARYKALGNGMAQPCADWIINRIAEEVKR